MVVSKYAALEVPPCLFIQPIHIEAKTIYATL